MSWQRHPLCVYYCGYCQVGERSERGLVRQELRDLVGWDLIFREDDLHDKNTLQMSRRPTPPLIRRLADLVDEASILPILVCGHQIAPGPYIS
jgi:hypothetical protein